MDCPGIQVRAFFFFFFFFFLFIGLPWNASAIHPPAGVDEALALMFL